MVQASLTLEPQPKVAVLHLAHLLHLHLDLEPDWDHHHRHTTATVATRAFGCETVDKTLLGGSWVVIGWVISRETIHITDILGSYKTLQPKSASQFPV